MRSSDIVLLGETVVTDGNDSTKDNLSTAPAITASDAVRLWFLVIREFVALTSCPFSLGTETLSLAFLKTGESSMGAGVIRVFLRTGASIAIDPGSHGGNRVCAGTPRLDIAIRSSRVVDSKEPVL